MPDHKINTCKLIKEQLKADIAYSMRATRRSNKETGFPICEMPETKQWVAGYRRTGGAKQVTITECEDLPLINGKPFKTVGSYHTHPNPESNQQSATDAWSMDITGEKFACIGSAKDGKMACYEQTSKKDMAKIKEINKISNTTDKDYITHPERPSFVMLTDPILEKAKLCEITVEKVTRLGRLQERFRKPELPPRRF